MKEKMLLLLISLLLIMSGCSNNNITKKTKEDTPKDELVLAIDGETEGGFDPTTGWGLYGSPLFQSTLLTYDKSFNIEHDLATNYNVSEDGLSYQVEIRDDAVFSDGKELTAKDVVFTFETAKDSSSIIDLTNLKKVEAIDDYKVEFTLNKPNSTFVSLLTTTGIVPEHAYDDSYNENPVGSGPYQLTQWDKDQQLIVEVNPHYYGKTPEFKQLTFLFLSEEAAFAAAKAGEVDIVAITPEFASEDVPGMNLVELETVDNRGIVFPYVKEGEETDDGVPFGNDVTADMTIRKAIDLAVDRDQLVEGVLEGYGTRASSLVDNLPWWNEETEISEKDLEQAKELLEESGWKENNEGIREKEGLKASFDLLYPSGDQIRQSLSLIVADQLKEIGIEVVTKDVSWKDLEKLMYSSPVMMGWGSHNPIEMYNIYSSDTRGEDFYNINYYTNPTVDKHMERALQSTTQKEANEHWKKAQWDGETGFSSKGDASWVWLVNLKHLYFINENLEIGDQKIQPHGHGWPITDFINEWHWKE